MKFVKKLMRNLILFAIFFVVLALLFPWEDIRINLIMFATLKRGIITQNCFWWKMNDALPDATGAEVYTSLKKQGRFVRLNIMGKTIYLLTDIHDIQQLLEQSPNPFGPGVIKRNFFQRFIPQNVGIGVNPDWKYKREYNDTVLQTDKQHFLLPTFFESMKETMAVIQPHNFETFSEMAKRLTSKYIFGTYDYNPIIYKVFKQADSFFSAVFNINTVNAEDYAEYRAYLEYELHNPTSNTLLSLGNHHHSQLPTHVLIDQIPHWVFPIAGVVSVHLPRLLALLASHPDDLRRVVAEVKNGVYRNKDTYIRKCILELFRLNNAVNSTFRGLTDTFVFEGSDVVFEKGTEFVFFNNPVLRDWFEASNQFIPARWTLDLEDTTQAVMFNQGNQRCPGKELTLSLLTIGLVTYLEQHEYTILCNRSFTQDFIPYVINPCTLEFSV